MILVPWRRGERERKEKKRNDDKVYRFLDSLKECMQMKRFRFVSSTPHGIF